MRPALARLIAALALVGSACTAGSPGASPAAIDPGNLDGRWLYAAACATCHGADLKGTRQGPPFLDPIYRPGHHGDAAFLVAVRSGVRPHHWDFGPMAPVPGLSDAQVTAIVAFVREQQRAAGIR